jgi:GAF domain-containing protein
MRSEQRWPDYAQHAAGTVCSARSRSRYHIPRRDHRRARHLRRTPEAFGEQDVELAEEIAGWVAIAIGHAEATAQDSEALGHLRTAMMSRAVIEQAKGILMERHKITEDEAFTILAHASQRTNKAGQASIVEHDRPGSG